MLYTLKKRESFILPHNVFEKYNLHYMNHTILRVFCVMILKANICISYHLGYAQTPGKKAELQPETM